MINVWRGFCCGHISIENFTAPVTEVNISVNVTEEVSENMTFGACELCPQTLERESPVTVDGDSYTCGQAADWLESLEGQQWCFAVAPTFMPTMAPSVEPTMG